MDMNMFQSGHRRYGQKKGDGDTSVTGLEEDNWRYVEEALSMTPLKPVLDAEPVMKVFLRDCMILPSHAGVTVM